MHNSWVLHVPVNGKLTSSSRPCHCVDVLMRFPADHHAAAGGLAGGAHISVVSGRVGTPDTRQEDSTPRFFTKSILRRVHCQCCRKCTVRYVSLTWCGPNGQCTA